MKPFRFGVNAAGVPTEEWLAVVRRVEGLGYSTVHLPDHLTERPAPLAALAAAAAVTTRLRLGPFVLDNDFRHPVLLAREAATVDVLSGGRVKRWGISYYVVFDAALDAFAPIVARLTGT